MFFAKKIAYILKLLSEERLILLGNEDRVACDQCANFQKKISRCFKDIPDLLLYFLYLNFFVFDEMEYVSKHSEVGYQIVRIKEGENMVTLVFRFSFGKKFFV